MDTILNLTQHPATQDQIEAGVINLAPADNLELKDLLTFDKIPNRVDLINRCTHIIRIANSYNARMVMLGGAPYLIAELDIAFSLEGYQVVYSFSKRMSIEFTDTDTGEVTKTNIFKHIGWVLT
jgi:hypothetical protein